MKKTVVIILIFLAFFFAFWRVFLTVPKNFPSGVIIQIEKGFDLSRVSDGLSKSGIIKNSNLFYFLAVVFGKSDEIKYGSYIFSKPVSSWKVLDKITKGDFSIRPVRVVVPEGSTLKDIAAIFKDFENFDENYFSETTKDVEGYLFPDTYFFLPNAETEEIFEIMSENFKNKVGEISKDDLIMASLIEKEAPKGEERKIISGILWKRLKINMLLQVDAVFPYITGKKGEKVTFEDLKIISPYNTYLNKGLPPSPIGNPGLDAINAALNPQESSYLYYIHDKQGKTYFAKTYQEHLNNIDKYLR